MTSYTLPTTGFYEGETTPSTIGEVWDASVAAQKDIANPLSRENVLDDEYEKRIKAVETATGIKLFHPRRDQPTIDDYREAQDDPERGWLGSAGTGMAIRMAERRFHRELDKLAEQFPDKADAIGASRTVWDTAYGRVREAERRLADVTERSPLAVPVPGLGPVDPIGLAGSMWGFVQDPINIATMFVGPGGSASKGILWNASRQAAAGAAQQALIEPFTQQWRAEAGLDFGFRQAAGNILMAGAASGALDAAGRSAGRALLGRPLSGAPSGADTAPGALDTRAPELGAVANDTAPATTVADADGSTRAGAQWAPEARNVQDPDAALEAAARRLPEGHPVRLAAEGDAAASIELVERMGISAEDAAVRAALDQTKFELLQETSVKGFLDEANAADAQRRILLDSLARETAMEDAIAHAADPETNPPPVIIRRTARPDADVSTAPGAQWAPEGATPTDLAELIRERPELAGEVPVTTEAARGIHALARLDDAAFAEVRAGAVSPEIAAVVAAAPPGTHADVLARVIEARPRDTAEARRVVAEAMQRSTDVETAARLLGTPDAQETATRLAAPEFDEPVGKGADTQTQALRGLEERAKSIDDLQAKLRAAADAADRVQSVILPRLRDGGSLADTAYTRRFLDADDDLAEKLADAAARTLPPSVRLVVEDRLRVGAYDVDGYFDRRGNILAVALDAGDPAFAFSHERIHALQAHGLFTPSEWALLVSEANAQGARQAMGRDLLAQYRAQLTPQMVRERLVARGVTSAKDAPASMLMEELQAAKLYDPANPRGSLERAGLWDEAALQGMIDEEAVAFLAERWRAGEAVPKGVAGLMERIMAFLERLRNVLHGQGFQTLDDIFERIDSGEVAGRTFDTELQRATAAADADADAGTLVSVCKLF
jgi:hypothetical protein